MRFHSSYGRAVWNKPPYHIFAVDTADFCISAVLAQSVVVAHYKKLVVTERKFLGCNAVKGYVSGYLRTWDIIYQYAAVRNPNGIAGQCDDAFYHCTAERRAIKDYHIAILEVGGAAVYYGKLHILIGRGHGLALDEV